MFKDASDNSKEINNEVRSIPKEVVNSDGADRLPREIGIQNGLDSQCTQNKIGSNTVRVENVRESDSQVEQIGKTLGSPEGLISLIKKHPEKAELWKSQLEALETLNDPEATYTEIRSAQSKLSNLKSQLQETAVKDILNTTGFDVEVQQRIIKGESGGTRPDVIAMNNTGLAKEIFGATIQSGEKFSVECKCGRPDYMTTQLKEHIPNQLSGQEGSKFLLTTSDINNAQSGLAQEVCNRYDAKLVIIDVSVTDIENAIKGVA